MAGKITCAKLDNRYIIRFSGEIRYTDCPVLDNFLKKLFSQEDCEDIAIDLTETASIDSTNLGYLAKITNFMRQRFNRKAVMVSTNEDVNRTLESVGFDEVFEIIAQRPESTHKAPVVVGTAPELTPAMILEAHQVLSDLSEENRRKFKDVVELFEKEAKEE